MEPLHIEAMDMWVSAKRHGDEQYLLPRRITQDPVRDTLYAAATWLVDNGFAEWLRGSSMAPGIRLTGRPWPLPEPRYDRQQARS
jgi:hypothetical protein